MRIILIVALVGAVLGGADCGGESDATDTRAVVAGFYPLAYAAERLTGPDTSVVNLTPAGGEPHDVELSARDVERVRSADVVLYLGRGFQPALERAASETEGEAIDLLDGVGLLDSDEGADPHVWLDPLRYAEVVERIGEELDVDASPLVAELEALHDEFDRGLADCERRVIVTSHAAFAYLAARYRLEQV